MSINALSAIYPEAMALTEPSLAPLKQFAPVGRTVASRSGFSEMVMQGLQGVNEQLLIGQADLQQLSVGNVQNLHQIMIRLEESRLAFQLTMQVRNRLLESYQEVMRMQI